MWTAVHLAKHSCKSTINKVSETEQKLIDFYKNSAELKAISIIGKLFLLCDCWGWNILL